jgi:hypothetical protein
VTVRRPARDLHRENAAKLWVEVSDDVHVDRLGFVKSGRGYKSHVLFVAELAAPPGRVAHEVVFERRQP